MSRLVETIKSENGELLNITFHNERMMRSSFVVFGIRKIYNLNQIITVPQFAMKGIYKCRVLYNDKTIEIDFQPYNIRIIRSLKLVADNEIIYAHKFVKRENINRLFELRDHCDDILIIKKGMVTDCSYANVILKNFDGNWVTPSTFLLPGTRRASLLHNKEISEAEISYSDLKKFTEIRLINAMIGMYDTPAIPVSEISI